MNTQRVLMLTHNFWPFAGGVEQQALHQARELRARGIDVRVLTAIHQEGLPTYELVEGVPVYRYWYPYWLPAKFLRKISNYIACFLTLPIVFKQFRFSILHIHQVQWLTMVGAFYKKRFGYSIIAKGSSSGYRSDAVKFYSTMGFFAPLARAMKLRDVVYKKIDKIVCISTLMYQEFGAVSVPETQRTYIPNGIMPIATSTVLQKENDAAHDIELISTNRLEPVKQPLLHIKAAAIAAKELTQKKLHYTNYNAGSLHQECLEYLRDNNLTDIVSLPGHTPHDIAMTKLQSATIFLNISAMEGLSNSILEAMSCKVPMIISDVGGARDLIGTALKEQPQDAVDWGLYTNGILVSAKISAENLAKAIVYLSQQSDYAKMAAENAFLHIQNTFLMPKVIDQYISLYNSLR